MLKTNLTSLPAAVWMLLSVLLLLAWSPDVRADDDDDDDGGSSWSSRYSSSDDDDDGGSWSSWSRSDDDDDDDGGSSSSRSGRWSRWGSSGGSTDSSGLPNTSEEIPSDLFSVEIEQELMDRIGNALPESRAIDAAFLNADYSPNLVLGQDANISVTAIDEGAGYRNSFGYFSYSSGTFEGLSKSDVDVNGNGYVTLDELTDIDGVDAGWVFPNFSMEGKGGSLETGDSTWLGNGETFSAGTNVGFFLAQNAWENGRTDKTNQTFYSVDFLNPEAGADATLMTDSIANRSRHTAALFSDESKSELIFGFEDLNRTNRFANSGWISSDEDFNDALFVVRSNPAGAFSGSDVPIAPVTPTMASAVGAASLISLAFMPTGWRRRLRGETATQKNGPSPQ